MSGRTNSGSGQQSGASTPSTSSTSSSSLMAKFYQPMNTPFVPMPAPQQQQIYAPTVSSLGPHGYTPSLQGSAPTNVQLLANLASIPGYISDEAIRAYSQQNQQKLPQQQQQHFIQQPNPWQQSFSRPGPPSDQTQFSPQFASNQAYQPPMPGYAQDAIYPQPFEQPSNNYGTLNDPNAAIGALLKELKQTEEGIPSSSEQTATQTSTSYYLYSPTSTSQPRQEATPSIPPQSQTVHPTTENQTSSSSPSSSSLSITSQTALIQDQTIEDFSSGKITPQLLKKLAAMVEADSHNGSALLNEIKRLRSRQNEMRQIKSVHREELKKFDQRVVRAMDKEITLVQESLAQAGVPLMKSTQDPSLIASQIRVLRLLEDMLQT
ncbi:hypothetical protein FBU30_001089 [Linnemannia zychae]|nr:hypothetical protein FBU30_001089 [Linnemannia zychae]